MFVQVCGAARAVTGSCYLVGAGDNRFLVDCGMHQGGGWETRVDPLYTEADARRTIELFRPIPYHMSKGLRLGVTVQFYDAGHILGSAFIELHLEDRGGQSRVVFSRGQAAIPSGSSRRE
ncbi:MAG: hypothetical protein ACOX8V_03470 [Thermoleophilia bacterium]|jgi:Cft2 family RNA processing exonuclease